MTNDTKKLDDLEVRLGMVQDELQKLTARINDKFHDVEQSVNRTIKNSLNRMMEMVTNGHEGGSNISRENKRQEEQLKSLFVERNEDHKIEIYGDPIYDNYEDDDVLGIVHEGFAEFRGRKHDDCNTNHPTNLTEMNQFSKSDPKVLLRNSRQFFSVQVMQEDHCVEYVYCTSLNPSYQLHAPLKVAACVDRVVYSPLLPKDSPLHLSFQVSLLRIWVSENEPVPRKPLPLRDKEIHAK